MTTAPTIEREDEIILHSGNISGVAKLTKRATQSTANEVDFRILCNAHFCCFCEIAIVWH